MKTLNKVEQNLIQGGIINPYYVRSVTTTDTAPVLVGPAPVELKIAPNFRNEDCCPLCKPPLDCSLVDTKAA